MTRKSPEEGEIKIDGEDEAPSRPSQVTKRGVAPFATTLAKSTDELEHVIHESQNTESDSKDEKNDDDPWIGRVLANVYRIEHLLGEGGMGAVYRAKHIHLEKAFAIKVLGERIATNETAVQRLKQEAIAASSIDHDHIIDVVNFDETEDGHVFIVMEYLKGVCLADEVITGPMPYARACTISLEICDALQAAHDRGIVHRDLKPENVFLIQKRGRERVKVLDFGISKVKSPKGEENVRMTKTGQLLGTPVYLSPEQARGDEDPDHRVDIYALGVMLFEMICGCPPFMGRNYFELLWKHGNEAPPGIGETNDEVHCPPALEKVIHKALEKSPVKRFESMAQFAQAIQDATQIAPRGVPSSFELTPPKSTLASLTTSDLTLSKKHANRSWMFGVALLGLVTLGWIAFNYPNERLNNNPPDAENAATGNPTSTPQELPIDPTPPNDENNPSADQSTALESQVAPEDSSPTPTYELNFTSTPRGARVEHDGVEIGRTPFTHQIDSNAETLDFVFRQRGQRRQVQWHVGDDPNLNARFRRPRSRPTPRSSLIKAGPL